MFETISTASSTRVVPAMRWLLLAMTCAFALTMLSACNTVEGAGKDVERAGEGVQDMAD